MASWDAYACKNLDIFFYFFKVDPYVSIICFVNFFKGKICVLSKTGYDVTVSMYHEVFQCTHYMRGRILNSKLSLFLSETHKGQKSLWIGVVLKTKNFITMIRIEHKISFHANSMVAITSRKSRHHYRLTQCITWGDKIPNGTETAQSWNVPVWSHILKLFFPGSMKNKDTSSSNKAIWGILSAVLWRHFKRMGQKLH